MNKVLLHVTTETNLTVPAEKPHCLIQLISSQSQAKYPVVYITD